MISRVRLTLGVIYVKTFDKAVIKSVSSTRAFGISVKNVNSARILRICFIKAVNKVRNTR